MRTTQTAPQSKDTASQVELYMSFELADKTWVTGNYAEFFRRASISCSGERSGLSA